MPTPKYGRRKVRIDPRLPLPPGIVDVEIDDSKSVTSVPPTTTNNSYTGGISRDERPTSINPTDPAPVMTGTNPWGVAKIVNQELIISSDGKLVVEVSFQLPDWKDDYEYRGVIV